MRPRFAVAWALGLLSCGERAASHDATFDASIDASRDASLDAAADAGGDASSAGRDAAPRDAAPPPLRDASSEAGCSGPAPPCFVQCQGDAVYDPARCLDGAWACARGVLRSACPADACFGVPLPGEVCAAGRWTCRPAETDALELCPRFACASCEGFDAPLTGAGCMCVCDRDAGVRCQLR